MITSKFHILKNYGVIGVSLLLMVLFSFLSEFFLSWRNINMLATGQVIVGFFALGAMIPLAVGEFDISLGYMLGLTIMFGARLAESGLPIGLAFAAMILFAVALGAVNGIINVVLNVPSTISTLGVGTIFYGISLSMNNGSAINGVVPDAVLSMFRVKFLNLNITVWIFFICAASLYYIMEHTPLGKHIYAVGLSERVAYLAGIKTKLVRFAAFVLASFYIGVGGLITLARTGNAYPDTGPSYLLPGLAVVFFSITTHTTGRYNVPGMVASLIMLGITFNGISIMGAPFWTEAVVNGVILIIVVMSINTDARKIQIG